MENGAFLLVRVFFALNDWWGVDWRDILELKGTEWARMPSSATRQFPATTGGGSRGYRGYREDQAFRWQWHRRTECRSPHLENKSRVLINLDRMRELYATIFLLREGEWLVCWEKRTKCYQGARGSGFSNYLSVFTLCIWYFLTLCKAANSRKKSDSTNKLKWRPEEIYFGASPSSVSLKVIIQKRIGPLGFKYLPRSILWRLAGGWHDHHLQQQ